jgi:hypothetical protein
MTDDAPSHLPLLELPGAPEAVHHATRRLRHMVDDGMLSEEACLRVSILLGMFAAELTKGIHAELERLRAAAEREV